MATELVQSWGAEGPPVLWRRPVGQGLASPSLADGVLILFHRVGDEEIVEALDADSAASLWTVAYPSHYRDDYGWDEGPRAQPVIADGVVYTYGAEGVIQAVELRTGTRVWLVDTRERYGTEKGPYGAGSNLLVMDGKVMVNIGGPDGAGIVALDADTGDLVWSSTSYGAGYSTPMPATIGGVKRVFFFTRWGLVDVDPDTGSVRGELHWRSRSLASVNAASPMIVGERVFVSATYGTGAAMLEVTEDGFEPVWSGDEILSNHYAASILHDGTLYGYHGRQPVSPDLRAVDADTGEVLWVREHYGAGSILISGDTIVLLGERGELVLADVSREAFKPRVRFEILRPITRAYPALAGGVLYARDEHELVAVDLRPH